MSKVVIGRAELHLGDCLDILATLEPDSIDSCVCDPPYHLTSIVKRFGAENAAPAKVGATGAYARASRGFMGQQWDGGDVAFRPETWEAVYRVLRPGAHLVAFSSSRTYHRMACAIEDAGFEIRDCIQWIFASGFPKSHNISAKLRGSLPADALCTCAPDCQQTALGSQSGYPFCRGSDDAQPRAGLDTGQGVAPSRGGAQTHIPSPPHGGDWGGVASHNHSTSSDRLSTGCSAPPASRLSADCQAFDSEPSDTASSTSNEEPTAARKIQLRTQGTQHSDGGSASSSLEGSSCDNVNLPRCGACGKLIVPEGLGTALKPAHEPICLARKPLSEKNIAASWEGFRSIGCELSPEYLDIAQRRLTAAQKEIEDAQRQFSMFAA